jgi:hypothetical protein
VTLWQWRDPALLRCPSRAYATKAVIPRAAEPFARNSSQIASRHLSAFTADDIRVEINHPDDSARSAERTEAFPHA